MQGKASQRGRQKKKKKLSSEDAVRAVLLSSLFIGLAIALSVSLLILMPPREQQDLKHNGEEQTSFPAKVKPNPETAIQSGTLSTIKNQPIEADKDAKPKTGSPSQIASTIENSTEVPSCTTSSRKDSTTPTVPKTTRPMKPNGGSTGLVVSAPLERPPQPPPKHKGSLAIVLDDAGNNLRELEPFLKFPGPLTIAVLPGLPYSAEAARRIRAAGKEVILHQPMEAVGGQNPGPGAIYAGMSRDEIEAVLKHNLAEVGPVVGMNNHQGSKITADERIMEIVLAFCRRNGIYYLDSRTTADTVVPTVAERLGIRIGERDVFVDNIQEKAAMIRFMEEGLQKAEKKGAAIVIGHVWSNELAATLSELYPELIAQGFSLTTISRIMMGTFEDEGFGD